MTAKRLFIAIDISDEARRRAAAHIDQLRAAAGNLRISWEKPGKLHVTLKFLGNVDEQQITKIEDRVRTVANEQTAFTAELTGTGAFASVQRPHILWLGIGNDDGNVTELGRATESNLVSVGFAGEKRDFSPHLTIARIREPTKGRKLASLHMYTDFEPVRFDVTELVIYESHLEPTGSVYSVISRHAF